MGFIAVHCGAGYHKSHGKYNKLTRLACKAGVLILKDGGTALEAVKVAVMENDPLTNAGFGSNLTADGFVEGDASIMDGRTLLYGGCGAVQQVKNPIELAHNLCVNQSQTMPMGLVPPSLLVGHGGLQHAQAEGIKTVDNNDLVSMKALKQYKKYKKLLNEEKCRSCSLDTVGAVCIDDTGHVASACSSGGLILKRPGRVGQAALYASGVWADSFSLGTEASIAISTTGCGEHLVQTQLAKEISSDLKTCSCPTTELYKSMTSKFLNSRYLHNVKQKLGGALVLHISKNGDGSILWGHSTESMSVGYMKSTDTRAKSMISQLPPNIPVGTNINVGGTHFCVTK